MLLCQVFPKRAHFQYSQISLFQQLRKAPPTNFSVKKVYFHDTAVHCTDVMCYFPDKKLQQLNRDLKRFNVIYDKNLAVAGKRKVYKGLRCIPNLDDPE